MGEEMVSGCFRHALSVGFQRDVIRLQVQGILNADPDILDNDLLKKVQKIMQLDKENMNRAKGQKAKVNALNTLDHAPIPRMPPPRSDADSKLDNMILELQSLNVNMVEDRKERKAEMDEMRSRIARLEKAGDGNRDGYVKRKYVKCKSCEQRNVFCTHCAKCGEGGHKQRDCPKN